MNNYWKKKSYLVMLVAINALLTLCVSIMLVQASHALDSDNSEYYKIDENAVALSDNSNLVNGNNLFSTSIYHTTYDYNFTVTESIDTYIDPVTGEISCNDNIVLENGNPYLGNIRISEISLALNDTFVPISGNWKLTTSDLEVIYEGPMGYSQSYPDYIQLKPQEKLYLSVTCDKSGILEQRYINKNFCKFLYTYDYFNALPYANYVQKNSENQLTFYYDPYSDTREGENYILNKWTAETKDYMTDHYQDITSIVVDKSFSDFDITSVDYLFGIESSIGSLDNLKKIDMTYLQTTDSQGFDGFMSEIPNLEECIGLENLDTSSSTSFEKCFYNTKIPENLDLTKWDTSKARYLDNMFYGIKCSVGPDISNWTTSNVETLKNLFSHSEVEYFCDMSKWDTTSVTSLWATFYCCYKAKAAPDVGSWNTQSVTTCSNMFGKFGSQNGGVAFTINLKGWSWYKMHDCYQMFESATYLSAIYCNTNLNSISSLSGNNMTYHMFNGCINLNEKLSLSTTKTDRTYAYPKTEAKPDGFFTSC